MIRGQVQQVIVSLRQLGPRRLWQLGAAGAAVFLAVGLASYVASRPTFETLYTGLDPQELARATAVLREANISFDVTSDGATLLVENGQASRARMTLADRGLPRNPGAGYELFDKLGSLGLTSFMQEVTKARALEGELSRSIQSMHGVRAARVHIAPLDEGGFRRTRHAASASVIVRLSSSAEHGLAQAIRRLVAAATPGLAVDAVTVLSSDGTVLAGGGDSDIATPMNVMTLEKSASDAVQANVRRALAPVVGANNLNVSIALRLNADKRQITETIYNPDSRVERSVRTVKENQTSQNSAGQSATSVERNIPTDKPKADGKGANDESNKKEELINYEVSSKVVQTAADGYTIERLNVAVLINKAALLASLGDKNETALEKRLSDLSELTSAAAGVLKDRGDIVKVVAVEFSDSASELAPVGEPGLAAIAARQIGAIVNGGAIVFVASVAGLVAARALSRIGSAPIDPPMSTVPDAIAQIPAFDAGEASAPTNTLPPTTGNGQRKRAQKHLEALVESDERHAARVIQGWLRADA